MTNGAHVGSIDAVRDFRWALHAFNQAAREATCSFDLEVRRSLEWLTVERPGHWKQELRRCDDLILAAKIDLDRCRLSRLPGGEVPACSEKKKALERARQRREHAQQKLEAVRKWSAAVEREAHEYAGRANQLQTLLDTDLPRAVALLDKALDALAAYTSLDHSFSLPPVASSPAPTEQAPPIIQVAGEADAAKEDDDR